VIEEDVDAIQTDPASVPDVSHGQLGATAPGERVVLGELVLGVVGDSRRVVEAEASTRDRQRRIRDATALPISGHHVESHEILEETVGVDAFELLGRLERTVVESQVLADRGRLLDGIDRRNRP
jgi:hypothetical protein